MWTNLFRNTSLTALLKRSSAAYCSCGEPWQSSTINELLSESLLLIPITPTQRQQSVKVVTFFAKQNQTCHWRGKKTAHAAGHEVVFNTNEAALRLLRPGEFPSQTQASSVSSWPEFIWLHSVSLHYFE